MLAMLTAALVWPQAAAADEFAPGVGTETIWDGSTPLVDGRGRTAPGLRGVDTGGHGVGEVEFSRWGDAFVAEKSGRIAYFTNSRAPSGFLLTDRRGRDLSADTLAVVDTGLGGFAVDPAWPLRPYVYALYTSNRKIPQQGSGRWAAEECSPGGECVVHGSLERLTIGIRLAGWRLVPYIADRRALISDEWCQVANTHSVGDLAFGPDGALYASAGDGTPNGAPRPVQSELCAPSESEGGYSGRMAPLDVLDPEAPVSLNGKILRLDPETGQGAAGNPEAGSADANRRRVVGAGFRNPYRMAFEPGSSTLAVTSIGNGRREAVYEIPDPVAGVASNNSGWPCWEVDEPFQDGPLCAGLSPEEGTVMAPRAAWTHGQRLVDEPCEPTGTTSAMAVAYGGDGSDDSWPLRKRFQHYSRESAVPPQYYGALFFGDFGRGCVWSVKDGEEPRFFAQFDRRRTARSLSLSPDGMLYMSDFKAGSVRRFTFAGVSEAP